MMFPNFLLIPSQIERHLYSNDLIITPSDPQVLVLRSEFFEEIAPENFYSESFDTQMNTVDDFIYEKINWEQDYGRWKMVGLLLSPHEVIQNRAGDCQGQAAVTASLLISLGFQAWVVETPFHWWTHARDNVTGRFHNLNVHGHGRNQGNVLPQPIDLVYTQPTLACTDCPYIMSHNDNPTLYAAPPHKALAIAFTGAHIFVRSGLTLHEVSKVQLVIMGLVLGLMVALYASYVQGFSCKAVLKRVIFSAVIGLITIFGMSFWATFLYPVTLLHLIFTITFMFTYIASDTFNISIGEYQGLLP